MRKREVFGALRGVPDRALRRWLQAPGSLSAYAWRFQPAPGSRPKRMTLAALRAMTTSPESIAMSKDLKKRGWTFVGPTTVYAFMQAMGLVNDHVEGCHVRDTALEMRASLAPQLTR